jgi:protein-disulfide isomerase
MATLKVPVSSSDHIQGADKPSIVLVEYGDFQCPYCGMAYPVVKMLHKHYEKQLAHVFRNFPLSQIHPLAEPAAEAAEFAAAQGSFWQMHDLIFENQALLSLPFLLELGKRVGLPPETLEPAISNKKFEQKIQEDFLGGVRSGVNGTPTFFINEQRYDGRVRFEELVLTIDALLKV